MVVIDCAIGSSNTGDKLRPLEDETNRLKRVLADAMLDNAALKDLVTKTTDGGALSDRPLRRHWFKPNGRSFQWRHVRRL